MKRSVLISVTDKTSGQPIPAAIVKLVPSANMEERAKSPGLKYAAASNNDGLAELMVEFPAGGSHKVLLSHRISEKGSFGLDEDLHITAEGYRDFKESLVSLLGQQSLPTQNKLPIEITAHLEKQD